MVYHLCETIQLLRGESACCGLVNEVVCVSFLALQHTACHDWTDDHGVPYCFNRSVVLPCSHNNKHFALRLPPALPTVAGVPRLPPPQVRLGTAQLPLPLLPVPWHGWRAKLLSEGQVGLRNSCTSREAYPVQPIAGWTLSVFKVVRDGDFRALQRPCPHSCQTPHWHPPSADLETFSKAQMLQLRLGISSFLRLHARKKHMVSEAAGITQTFRSRRSETVLCKALPRSLKTLHVI